MEFDEKLEHEIYVKLARLCSKSEHCSPDVLKKIKELGGNSHIAIKIIERLEKENFLDDERFVKLYTREKFKVNKWGRIKIHYYLKMKGLNEEIIDKGLSEIEDVEYIQLLLSTMREKAKTVKGSNKFEKMGQIIRFTQSRGFEPELIHRYIDQAVS